MKLTAIALLAGLASGPFHGAACAAEDAPAFVLQHIDDPSRSFTPAQLKGQVWVLNVWASWCAPCRAEMPALQALADARTASVVGLNYRDAPDTARRFLRDHGDPFTLTVLDAQGKAASAWGVVGVPATHVIDKRGAIRWRHEGPVTAADVRSRLLPLIASLRKE